MIEISRELLEIFFRATHFLLLVIYVSGLILLGL